MKTLNTKITHSGFDLVQIHREGDYAIYKKQKAGHEAVNYEVIKIKRHDGYTIAGNFCPPAEMYPSNEQWGVLGFTCQGKDQAYKKLDAMKESMEASDQLDAVGTKRGRGRPKGTKNKKRS